MNKNIASPSRRSWIISGMALTAVAASYASYRLWSLTRIGAQQLDPATLDRLYSTEFADLANRPTTLKAYPGKVIVLNFWATWCPPCRQEMPAFSRIQQTLGEQGVQIIGVGIDSPAAIKEYALQFPVSYPLVVGGTAGMELMRQLGNTNAALPYTFALHRDGTPAFSHLGMLTEETLGERLRPVLAQAN